MIILHLMCNLRYNKNKWNENETKLNQTAENNGRTFNVVALSVDGTAKMTTDRHISHSFAHITHAVL